jgi:hypothetical protein
MTLTRNDGADVVDDEAASEYNNEKDDENEEGIEKDLRDYDENDVCVEVDDNDTER